jgi:hypothetical protein
MHTLTFYVVDAPSRVGRTHIQDALCSYGTVVDAKVVKVTDSEKTWKCALQYKFVSGMSEEEHGSSMKHDYSTFVY